MHGGRPGPNGSPATTEHKDAEPLVRKVRKLEGDVPIRHLQAVSDARKELTAEQLKQAQADGGAGNLESLFQ